MTTIIHRYNIIGTNTVIYEVLEIYNNHSSLTHYKGKTLGVLFTRPLPESLEKLKGEERYNKVIQYHRGLNLQSIKLIYEAYPHLLDQWHNCEGMGRISANETFYPNTYVSEYKEIW